MGPCLQPGAGVGFGVPLTSPQLAPQAHAFAVPAFADLAAACPATGPPMMHMPVPSQPQASARAAAAEAPGTAAFPAKAAISQGLLKEPRHISALTLESLSSNSLCRMLASADMDDDMSPVAQAHAASPSASFEKRLQDTPHEQAAVDPHAEADRRWKEYGEVHPISFDKSEIHVKNTFLDLEPKHTPMRAVHTAGGRLDLMGRQASGATFDVVDEDDE